jgi:hypothetical protein
MATWTPPLVQDVPRVTADTTGVPLALMRHYSNLYRGRNVYILSDNTVTENHPGREEANADGLPYVRLTLFGAHAGQVVSDADATILTAAGYGANLT